MSGNIFYLMQSIFSGISMLGSLGIIISYVTIPSLRRHPTSLVFFLSICDLLFSAKYFVVAVVPSPWEYQRDPTYCMVEAIWSQMFGLASISWTAVISVNLMISILNPFQNTATKEIFYHAYVWLLSISTTAVMATTHQYAPSGDGTCWFYGGALAGWGLFYGWLVLYGILGLYSVLYASLRTGNLARAESYQFRILFRMVLYVVVFLSTWMGPLGHKIYQLYTTRAGGPRTFEIFFQYLDMIGVSLQGTANAFVWFTNPTIFLSIKDKWMCCIHSDETPSLENDDREPGVFTGIRKALLEDKQGDVNQITVVLRKNMITCILLAIRVSLSESFLPLRPKIITTQDCQEVRQCSLSANDQDLESSESMSGYGASHQFPESNTTSSQNDVEMFSSNAFTFFHFSPLAFQRIRELSGVDQKAYRKSLHPKKFLKKISNLKFTDGRSGSFFVFSPCKQFILKTIPQSESKLLYQMMPSYLKHIEQNPNTLVTRFFGSFAMISPHASPLYIVILQNVFSHPEPIHRIFDLKGSWVNRGGGLTVEPVGKDLDLKEKIKIGKELKARIMKVLARDSMFLRDNGIMDYSLLLGIHDKKLEERDQIQIPLEPTETAEPEDLLELAGDIQQEVTKKKSKRIKRLIVQGSDDMNLSCLQSSDQSCTYFIGIIDILQEWNLNKQAERCLKIGAKCKDGDGLSALEPELYSDRFIFKISNIFE